MLKKAVNALDDYCYDKLERIEYIDADAICLDFCAEDRELGGYVQYHIEYFTNDYAVKVEREGDHALYKEDMVFVARVLDALGEAFHE